MTCTAFALVACGDGSLAAASPGPAGADSGDPGSDPDGGPGSDHDDGGPDGAPDAKTSGAPATAAGKMDGMCMFTSNPFRREDLLLVDPSGTRIAYPRLVGTAGELVIRDLETDKVTKLASLGSCTSQLPAGSSVPNWFATTPVSWMQGTPYGVLFADVDGALRLADWSGSVKAYLPPVNHSWTKGEVTAVDASASGIRATMVRRDAAAARLVTFASDGGAGGSVESADLAPAIAPGASIESVTSGDGAHVAAIIASSTLYAAPATEGATANVLYLTNASFRAERTPHGAFVSDLSSSTDDKPLLRHVDFPTALDQNLTHFPAGVVTTTPLGASLFYSEVTSSTAAATGLTTWRFAPGAPAVSLATTTPTNGNPLHYGTYRAEVTDDLSSYVFSLDGTGDLQNHDLVYSLSLSPSAAAYRPVRVTWAWALGGGSTLVTVEDTTLRFEELSSGKVKTTPLTVPSAQLRAVSGDGHLAFFEIAIYDSVTQSFTTGVDEVSDTGVHRVLRPSQDDGAIAFRPAWSDGLVAVLEDGFYFLR